MTDVWRMIGCWGDRYEVRYREAGYILSRSEEASVMAKVVELLYEKGPPAPGTAYDIGAVAKSGRHLQVVVIERGAFWVPGGFDKAHMFDNPSSTVH